VPVFVTHLRDKYATEKLIVGAYRLSAAAAAADAVADLG